MGGLTIEQVREFIAEQFTEAEYDSEALGRTVDVGADAAAQPDGSILVTIDGRYFALTVEEF
ncbi:MAG: hypothetical protein K0S37_763 [Microbacterium sp.]|jgi:hypothetical protein|nr:hypothetical protein [Microbacterium sp.]